MHHIYFKKNILFYFILSYFILFYFISNNPFHFVLISFKILQRTYYGMSLTYECIKVLSFSFLSLALIVKNNTY